MNNYPKYQYSIFLKNGRDEQIVIRAESFTELKEAKKNVNLILDKVKQTEIPDTKPVGREAIATPKCPVCGMTMVKRFKKADNSPFWGCSNYPDCKGVVPIKWNLLKTLKQNNLLKKI